jgi:hypothetical protein
LFSPEPHDLREANRKISCCEKQSLKRERERERERESQEKMTELDARRGHKQHQNSQGKNSCNTRNTSSRCRCNEQRKIEKKHWHSRCQKTPEKTEKTNNSSDKTVKKRINEEERRCRSRRERVRGRDDDDDDDDVYLASRL